MRYILQKYIYVYIYIGRKLPNFQIELDNFEFSRLDYSIFFMTCILPGKCIKIYSGAS